MRDELSKLATQVNSALKERPAAPAPAPRPSKPTKPKKSGKGTTKALDPAADRPAETHLIRFEIEPKVKCDLLAYSGLHCGGQLEVIRILPRGEHDGDLAVEAFQSLMLAGPYGTRLTFATHVGDDWEQYPWRSVVLTKGHCFIARNGKPAVRIMDLDFLDRPDARRGNDAFQESYPMAETRESGEGWTYGRPGAVKNQVRVIYIDKVS